MLSFRSGKKIAKYVDEDDKSKGDKFIYLKEKESDGGDIETTDEHKLNLFKKFIKGNKKLRMSEIDMFLRKYKNEDEVLPDKFQRIYEDTVEAVEDSLKHHLDFESTAKVFPIIEDSSYRMYVSGLSGSGKSTAIAQFLKNNMPKDTAGIFLFSPVKNDSSLASIKNLIHIDLFEIAEMLKRPLSIEDFPRGSVLIFDDVESYPKAIAKVYMQFRDIALERGRHLDISTITVSHNATSGNITKVSIRESQYWLLFPSFNRRDVKNILKIYGGLDEDEIDKIMRMNTRSVLYRKTVPKYAVGSDSVISFA